MKNTNLENNEKINSILKKIVIFLGIGILGMIFLLISFYITKKAKKAESNPNQFTKTIDNNGNTQSFDNNFKECNDTKVVIEENYISISSKNCNLIKIIPTEKASLRK